MRLLGVIRNPRVAIPLLILLSVGGLAGLARLLFKNWLIALIVALAVLLIVLVVLVVRMLIGREREDRLERGLEAPEQAEAASESATRRSARSTLQATFREALSEIRTRLRAGVNELPWYLLLGETGSGKTLLLEQSGLDVPAAYARSRVFGPTQALDFYLANEAIMLDTAGRYFDGGEADGEEWQTLLRLLRSSRPDCPIDGVIFTLPIPTLLGSSPDDLRARAHQLRRRLNELEDTLGVIAPVYLLLTKADRLEGFVEVARRLPQDKARGAFGWTNDRRDVVEESAVAEGFAEICERLDRFLPELILGEPEPRRQRSIFMLPQDLEAVGRGVRQFVAEAFKPSVYKYEKPFLRGVYLVCSRAEGGTLSPSLQRLGHEWARTQHAEEPGGCFLRDLFMEIIVGDEGVAVPGSRLGPLARRVLVGAGLAVGLVALIVWGLSFADNYSGSHRLATSARLVQSSDPPLPDVDELRAAIEEEGARAQSLRNRLGFGRLERAVERARRNFVRAFDRHYEDPTKERLAEALRRRDDRAIEAAVVLAADLDFLAGGAVAGSVAPDLSAYFSPRIREPERYAGSYRAYVSWLSEGERVEAVRDEQELFERVADLILDLRRLEELTRSPAGSYPSVSYPRGLEPASDDPPPERLPGIYTRHGFDGLVSGLLEAYERSGAMSPGKLGRFRRTYLERFERGWRRHLLDAPELARPDAAVKESPYLALVDQLEENTSVELPWDDGVPEWMEMIHEVRADGREVEAEEAAEPEGGSAPWSEYLAALENVAIDVEDARTRRSHALSLVRDVAGGEPNSFADALSTVREIMPRGADATASAKLRKLLELPILNGFSAVADSALAELDESWRQRIAEPFGSACDERCLAALYGQGGELERFRRDEIEPFYGDAGPKPLLAERGLPFGPDFLAWMENGSALQRRLPAAGGFGATRVPVRVRGIPSRVDDPSGLLAKRVELRLRCPEGPQVFSYRAGSQPHTFSWTSACDELTLRVVLARSGETGERQLQRTWRGPFALPSFLQQGTPSGAGRLGWELVEGDLSVLVRYEILSGQELREMAHRTPPGSMGG